MKAVSTFSSSGHQLSSRFFDWPQPALTLMDLPLFQLGQVGMGPSVRAESVALRAEVPERLGFVVDTAIIVALLISPDTGEKVERGRTFRKKVPLAPTLLRAFAMSYS
jgi:hypothetical protein